MNFTTRGEISYRPCVPVSAGERRAKWKTFLRAKFRLRRAQPKHLSQVCDYVLEKEVLKKRNHQTLEHYFGPIRKGRD